MNISTKTAAATALAAVVALGGYGFGRLDGQTRTPYDSAAARAAVQTAGSEKLPLTANPSPRTLSDMLDTEHEWTVEDERERLIQRHDTSELFKAVITLEKARQAHLFDVRCFAAGGEVLLSDPPMCTANMPAMPAVPKLTRGR